MTRRPGSQENMVFKVSIIIPVFNAEAFIERAVMSTINLSATGEVILVDDGSSDHSLRICSELASSFSFVRVFTHANKKNQGAAATRNLGIKNARFDFVSFLDADDYYLPNRFIKDQEIFKSDSAVDGVYGFTLAKFENESARKKFKNGNIAERTTLTQYIESTKLFKALILGGYGSFHTSGITIKKSLFGKVGLFNERIRYGEDTELWLKMSLMGKLIGGSIDEPIAIRWVHDTNSIHQYEKIIPYRDIMYESLFKWMLTKSFSFEEKNLIFNSLLRCSYNKGTEPLKLLMNKTKNYPFLIFNSFWYKKIKLELSKR